LTNSSNAHVHAIFAEAAFLAGKAIEVATELQRMPGMFAEAFAETLVFRAAWGARGRQFKSPVPTNSKRRSLFPIDPDSSLR
jgi:hypothetical protein